MNDRIKELARQAREQTEEFNSVRNKLTTEEWEEIYNEKFAELIVKECADIAKHHVMNISTYGDAEFVDEQIKQHFGVEE